MIIPNSLDESRHDNFVSLVYLFLVRLIGIRDWESYFLQKIWNNDIRIWELKEKRSTHKALYNFHSISSTSLFHARKFIVWSKYSITCKGFLGTFPGVSSLLVCFNVVAKPYHPVLQDDLNASIWLVCALKIESYIFLINCCHWHHHHHQVVVGLVRAPQ